jgi:conjugative transfer signal peptidase TraF
MSPFHSRSRFEQILGYVLFSSAVSYATWIVAVHFGLRFNVEPSMPMGAYWRVPGPVERGATVGACLPSQLAQYALEQRILPAGPCPSGVVPVVKEVAAVAGDVVDVSDSVVRVNGQPWPYSAIRRVSCFGRRIDMRVPSGRYIIAPDSVFLMGVNPCSWDSRYWGSVSRTTVARWNPLITLPQEKRKST